MQKNNAFCSICTVNYTAYAAVLNDSLKKVGHNEPHYVLIVDFDEKYRKIVEGFGFKAVPLESLAIPNVEELIRKYSAFELSNVLKPFFMEWLLKNHPEIDILIYLDTDIYVYDKFSEVFEYLNCNQQISVLLTPHLKNFSSYNKLSQGYNLESLYMKAGLYNGGFYALRNDKKSIQFMEWQKKILWDYGYNAPDDLMFVDQKILDFAPCLFDFVSIYKNDVYNISHWNYHDNKLQKIKGEYLIGGKKLVFFHFSHLRINEKENLLFNINLDKEPILKDMAIEYFNKFKNIDQNAISNITYGFNEIYSHPYQNKDSVKELKKRLKITETELFAIKSSVQWRIINHFFKLKNIFK